MFLLHARNSLLTYIAILATLYVLLLQLSLCALTRVTVCGECGSPIAHDPEAAPEIIAVKAGTLETEQSKHPDLFRDAALTSSLQRRLSSQVSACVAFALLILTCFTAMEIYACSKLPFVRVTTHSRLSSDVSLTDDRDFGKGQRKPTSFACNSCHLLLALRRTRCLDRG